MAESSGRTGSQGSSHFPLEPVSAAVLAQGERKRRDRTREIGAVTVGCPEMDEYLLLGGLERGSVVGLSSEDEGAGLLIAMQSVARSLVRGDAQGAKIKATIVTTQPVTGVLVVLRDATRQQLHEKGIEGDEMKTLVRGCLERVSVSRVFDLEGLWEVLEDLDSAATEEQGSPRRADPPPPETLQNPSFTKGSPLDAGDEAPLDLSEEGQRRDEQASSRLVLPELKPPRRLEVADSEGEDELSSASSSPLSSPPDSPPQEGSASPARETAASQSRSPARPDAQPPQQQLLTVRPSPNAEPPQSALPDIIVITHFSAILTTLFTNREKKSAHTSLQLLSSHLRYLSRTLPSNPLILILNSTASSARSSADTGNPQAGGVLAPRTSEKPLDPTLRSIFNPPPLALPGYRHGAASRKNKPSFGLVFTQLLDLHLLCTRMPRDPEDAEKLYAPLSASDGAEVRFVWAVEVLLDEIGVWETQDEGKAKGPSPRKPREQRWAVIDVIGGKIVDAFPPEAKVVPGEIRLAAGFGGPRV